MHRFAAMGVLVALTMPAGAGAGPLDDVTRLAATSTCATARWQGQGRAPDGFIQGMALIFAKSVCHADDPDIAIVSAAKSAASHGDVLAVYDPQFRARKMPNEAGGLDTLRHVYVLMIGLGMRESTGRYCAGRDSAGTKVDAKTVEAGLFQTSFGTSGSEASLTALFNRYRADQSRCFRNVFARGVRCDARDARNWGEGPGAEWQRLTKSCPAFATEHAAIVMRTIGGAKGTFGPIMLRSVALRPECDAMLSRVQSLVRSDTKYCSAF